MENLGTKSESNEISKRRKTSRRSRNGCLTCKIRRVKCDETRPICNRCIQFQIKCDGYPSVESKLTVRSVIESRPLLLPKSTIRAPSSVPVPLSIMHFGDAEEQRYFNIWLAGMSVHQHDFFNQNSTWCRIVVQMLHIPSARHGIVALGALGYASEQERKYSSGNLGHEYRPLRPNVHHKAALEHYGKAIKEFRRGLASGEHDLRTILLNCLMILGFDAYNGNCTLALAQIRGGIKLLEQCKVTSQKHIPLYSSPNPYAIEDEVVQALGRLEVQAIYAPDPRPLDQLEKLREQGTVFVRNLSKDFESLNAARIHLELIIRRVEQFLSLSQAWAIRRFSASPGERDPDFQAVDERKRACHLEELQQWRASFDIFMKKANLRDEIGALLLQLHYKSAHFSLVRFFEDPMRYDQFEDEVWEIVHLGKEIQSRFQAMQFPRYTADMGFIMPLYLLGLTCRNPAIRNQIVETLLSESRREGVWDSILSGKTIQWVQALEEKHLREGIVPGWARCQPVHTQFDFEHKRAMLVTQQRNSAEDLVGEQKTISISW